MHWIFEAIHFILLFGGGVSCLILLSGIMDNQLHNLLDYPDEE